MLRYQELSEDEFTFVIQELLGIAKEEAESIIDHGPHSLPYIIRNWYLVMSKEEKLSEFGDDFGVDLPSPTYYHNQPQSKKKEILGVKFVYFLNDQFSDNRKFY